MKDSDRLSSSFTHGRPFLGAVSFLSGAAALIYEITWVRLFSVLFGNSTYAASSVLAVFMAGLALGGYAFGRWIDGRARPLRIYGFLEIAIGVSAVLVPYIIRASEPLIAALYRGDVPPILELTATRIVLALAVLIVPTALMGATLPVLGRHFVESRGQVADRVGFLYGVNTLGAVLGCALTGFFFIRFLGVHLSSYLACGVSLLIGTVVLVVERTHPVGTAPSKATVLPGEERPDGHPYLRRCVLAAFFLSGLTALSYEVLWARILGFMFQSGMSIYAFTLMLCLFLVGVGLGSLLYSRWFSARRSPLRLFATLEILVGFSVFFGLYVASRGEVLDRLRSQEFGFLGHLLQAVTLLFVPTVLFGVLFPLACELIAGNITRLGASLGKAYGSNLIGSVTGPLLTGFVLIPGLGSELSLKILITANVVIGASLLLVFPERRHSTTSRLASTLLLVAGLLFVFKNPVIEQLLNSSRGRVVAFKEGPATSVLAVEVRDGIALNVGGAVGAGTLPTFRGCTELLAYIPLLLHDRPRNVVTIGFGTGRTPGFLARADYVDQVELVDVSEAVFEVGREVFSTYNQGVLDSPKTARIVDDGFNFMKYTTRRYDVISVDPFTPHTPGSARLYTRDFLEHSKSKLKPGGMLVLWVLPVWAHSKSFLTALNTFHEVFAHTTVWVTPDGSFLLFVATDRTLEVDTASLRGRFSNRQKLASGDSYVIRDVSDFLRCFRLDEAAVRDLLASESRDLSVFTVNRPNLEFLIHTDTSRRIPESWLLASRDSSPRSVTDDLGDAPRVVGPPTSQDAGEAGPPDGSHPAGARAPDPAERVTVAHVPDGDSAVLTDGRRVRYLGIDCPETRDSGAESARELNRRLVEGKSVLLRFLGEREDQHGRLLALVYLPASSERRDDRCVNAELLSHGLAWLYLENPSPDDRRRLAPLFAAQETALTHRRGMWKKWLSGGLRPPKPLVCTDLRIHSRSCPLIDGRNVQAVRSLAEAFKSGKSPCRGCRPLGQQR